jgi:hypothetical protein
MYTLMCREELLILSLVTSKQAQNAIWKATCKGAKIPNHYAPKLTDTWQGAELIGANLEGNPDSYLINPAGLV